jgi:hypothetical protein
MSVSDDIQNKIIEYFKTQALSTGIDEKVDKERKIDVFYPPEKIRDVLEYMNRGGKDSFLVMDCYKQLKLADANEPMKMLNNNNKGTIHPLLLCSILAEEYYDGVYAKFTKQFTGKYSEFPYNGFTNITIKSKEKLYAAFIGNNYEIALSFAKYSEENGVHIYNFDHYCKFPQFLISPAGGDKLNIYIKPNNCEVTIEYTELYINNHAIVMKISSIWNIYKRDDYICNFLNNNDTTYFPSENTLIPKSGIERERMFPPPLGQCALTPLLRRDECNACLQYMALGAVWLPSILFDLQKDTYSIINNYAEGEKSISEFLSNRQLGKRIAKVKSLIGWPIAIKNIKAIHNGYNIYYGKKGEIGGSVDKMNPELKFEYIGKDIFVQKDGIDIAHFDTSKNSNDDITININMFNSLSYGTLDDEKPDSAESINLLADKLKFPVYAIRCSSIKNGYEYYLIDGSKLTIIKDVYYIRLMLDDVIIHTVKYITPLDKLKLDFIGPYHTICVMYRKRNDEKPDLSKFKDGDGNSYVYWDGTSYLTSPLQVHYTIPDKYYKHVCDTLLGEGYKIRENCCIS